MAGQNEKRKGLPSNRVCDLEAAKRYKAQFEKEDEEKRSYRVKKKRIYEESN